MIPLWGACVCACAYGVGVCMCVSMCVCVHVGASMCVHMCVHVCVWCMGVHVLAYRDLVGHIYCEQEINNTSKYINQWVCVTCV